jgi:uncharacterized protein DUF3618
MSKSSAQLEREAELARSQLAATLEELRSRITPGQLVDQTLDYARDTNVGELVRNLGRDARDNPLPLALMGVGLAWLMVAKGRRARTGDGYGAALDEAAMSASGAYHDASVAAADAGGRIRAGASAAGGSFLALVRDQPLVLAGIGVALGALLGAALPATETENRLMGGASDAGDFPEVRDANAVETSVVPAAPGEHAEP